MKMSMPVELALYQLLWIYVGWGERLVACYRCLCHRFVFCATDFFRRKSVTAADLNVICASVPQESPYYLILYARAGIIKIMVVER